MLNFLPRVNKKNDNNIMRMSFQQSNTEIPTPQISSLSEIVKNDTPPQRVMQWAAPTWFLFHTLAEKVSDDRFVEIRTELLKVIYTIVTLLPCPICSEHGKAFLDGINFNTIVTKENLKYMLFDFHNLVNNKKNYSTFLYTDLVKYETAITNNIIQIFMFYFTKNSGSIRLISDDLHRKRTTVELKSWFNKNIGYFDP